jgi:hypothetical protein
MTREARFRALWREESIEMRRAYRSESGVGLERRARSLGPSARARAVTGPFSHPGKGAFAARRAGRIRVLAET